VGLRKISYWNDTQIIGTTHKLKWERFVSFRTIKWIVGILLTAIVPGHCESDTMQIFDGVWVSITPPGPHVIFNKIGFSQREASLPTLGQATINPSNGEDGSNFRISGPGFTCYYLILTAEARRKMVWELKSGQDVCLASAVFEQADNPSTTISEPPSPPPVAPVSPAAGQIATAPTSNVPPPPSSIPHSANFAQSDFIFPDSDVRLLSRDDLKSHSTEELSIARNDTFARKGRYFKSLDLIARFSRFAWYTPNTWNPQLNSIETANVELLERAESAPTATSDFIFPDSDRRLLTAADLIRLSKSELRIARNEIFARRGRSFDSADLKAHFARFSWYSPNTWNPKLNPIEAANVALMEKIEKR
jgi:YARHG domain